MKNDLCPTCLKKLEEDLYSLQCIVENLERLPSAAMHAPATNYDLYSCLSLLSRILRASCCKSDIWFDKESN
jgi:hypothetical protein